MTRLINDLLDVSRLRTGHGFPIRPAAMNLHQTARDMVAELEAAEGQPSIDLEVQGRGEGVWDAERMAQVLGNLLGNALKFCPDESTVQLCILELGNYIRITVHNRGPAIPANVIPFIFDPFRRASEQGAPSNGIGLGLFIVKQIVEAHRGTVAVESNDDVGTIFTVNLPRNFSGAEQDAVIGMH